MTRQDNNLYVLFHDGELRYHAHNRENAERHLPHHLERGWVFYAYQESPKGLCGSVTIDAWLEHSRLRGTTLPFANIRTAQGVQAGLKPHLEKLLRHTAVSGRDRASGRD